MALLRDRIGTKQHHHHGTRVEAMTEHWPRPISNQVAGDVVGKHCSMGNIVQEYTLARSLSGNELAQQGQQTESNYGRSEAGRGAPKGN